MLKKIASVFLMTLILVFGGLQLTVQSAEASNPACIACCPPSVGGGWLYDCSGPYPTEFGNLVGCAYTDGTTYGYQELYFCGQHPQ